MSRLYVVECGFTSTGAKADHRLALRSPELHRFAASIAARFLPDLPETEVPHPELAEAIASDLSRARGRSLVIAGHRQPPEVHQLAMLLNDALGNIGNTVVYREDPIIEAGEPSHDLALLAKELSGGRVKRLVVLGGNPVYTAPANLDLAALIGKAGTSAYLGLYDDETAAACEWRIGESHFLESWGDARAADGTTSLVQPLIRPLFAGRTRAQILSVFTGAPDMEARALLEKQYGTRLAELLRTGIVPDTAAEPVSVSLDARRIALPESEAVGLELALCQSSTLHDGRFAENPWLQELPDPMTRLCWGNAALFAPKTAARLGLTSNDIVRISRETRSVEAPVFLLPGLPEDSVTLSLGHGRLRSGVDAFRLQTSEHRWFVPGIRIERLPDAGEALVPPCVQPHSDPLGREIVLSRTLAEYRKNPSFAEHLDRPPPSVRKPWPERGHQWGMAIDLNTCVGCNACVIACQAENNVPIVGKINVQKSREMHWLRLDRYFTGDEQEPEVVHQPMLCQHCEKAPCEYVCPVNATVHSPDGLNEMVYNRCVGTRFCSNNCPYKVRRFNWFDFNREATRVEQLHYNPDVTVRARGVMEKCTYCVQRIRRAEIAASVEGRELERDEVVTACQQACPSQAIVFGDLNDPKSKVHRLHEDPRTYAVLHDLGTQPRTRYLAAIRNKKESGT